MKQKTILFASLYFVLDHALLFQLIKNCNFHTFSVTKKEQLHPYAYEKTCFACNFLSSSKLLQYYSISLHENFVSRFNNFIHSANYHVILFHTDPL